MAGNDFSFAIDFPQQGFNSLDIPLYGTAST